jgi:four helix bundle protein
VFVQADELVMLVYSASTSFPVNERFGLQLQLRKAAVSVAANIVEGCARRKQGEYVNFLNIATGSAAEAAYLVQLAGRLGMLSREADTRLGSGYTDLVKGLKSLVNSLDPE